MVRRIGESFSVDAGFAPQKLRKDAPENLFLHIMINVMYLTTLWKTLEDRAARFLDGRPHLSRTARTAYRALRRNILKMWALRGISGDRTTKPVNVFHASVQRTGSRWIRAVFSDPRIRKHTGLVIYPQHEYEIGGFHHTFPKYTFVPGLYTSYEQYIRIEKPEFYRTFYVIRDPRNTVLSWYRSMKSTHRLVNKSVQFFRNRLSPLDKEEGIEAAIRLYQVKLSYMRDWVGQSEDDPNVLVVKMEDLIEHPQESFGRIFDHCCLPVPSSELGTVLADLDKSGMRRRNRQRRKGSETDYREVSTNWRREFTDHHQTVFREVNGNLVKVLGYDT